MSNSSTSIFLALLWAIFLSLFYFSVFRSTTTKSGGKRGKNTSSLQKSPSANSVLISLAVVLIVRIALSFISNAIVDITSSTTLWWHTFAANFSEPLALLLSKLPAILADLFSAWILYRLSARYQVLPKTLVTALILLWALNPYSLFATTSFVQMISVSLALLLGALYLSDSELPLAGLWSGICAGLALLIHPHAYYFVILLIVFFILTLKNKENSALSAAMFFIPMILFGGLAIILFKDTQNFLFISKTLDESLNLPTLNAFNFYTLMDSWKESWYNAGSLKMDSRLFFLPVRTLGPVLSVLSVIATAWLYARSDKKNNIFFYCGLLSLSLYMFSTGMTPLAVLPAALFFYSDYAICRSNGSLILGFLSSVCGLANIGYVALNYRTLTELITPGNEPVAVISALLLFLTLVLAYFYGVKEHGKAKEEGSFFIFHPLALGKTKKMLKLDWILLAVFTIVALFSNLWELGDMTAPSSPWKASEGTETVIEVDGTPTRMTYFLTLGETGQALQVEMSAQTSSDGVTWEQIQNISESGYSYTWYDKSLNNAKRYMKFNLNADYMKVLEIGLYDNARNQIPVTVISGPAGAFDEQEKAQYGKTYKNSMYFDEVYHGRTAYEVTQGINEYEWTHPPLGKLIMSLGIRLFGMNPFGWRAAGALFGALLVPLMYLFGKKLFARTLPAAGMSFLMLFDTFRFAQTRIGTIDTYGVFFIILMYYFMYDFYSLNFKEVKSFKEIWKPLLFSGIFMGIGCAAKWIGFYAAAGLAVLFFMAFYRLSKENKKLFSQISAKTIGLCVIFFGVIPFAIYYASYLPHLSLFDYKFSEFIHQQDSMYSYHSGLESTHSYSSSWYMWPFMIRPVYMSGGGSGVTAGFMSRIGGIGNPAIWWVLLPALVCFIYLACKKLKDHRFSFLIIGFLAQYLSWVLIARTTYQYHFFASLPFLFAMLLYVLFWLKDNYRAKPLLWGYAILVVIAFIAIFPAVSGLELPNDSRWFDAIKAFDSWNYL